MGWEDAGEKTSKAYTVFIGNQMVVGIQMPPRRRVVGSKLLPGEYLIIYTEPLSLSQPPTMHEYYRVEKNDAGETTGFILFERRFLLGLSLPD